LKQYRKLESDQCDDHFFTEWLTTVTIGYIQSMNGSEMEEEEIKQIHRHWKRRVGFSPACNDMEV